MGIRCKRPKLELLHGPEYQQGRKRREDYKHVASVKGACYLERFLVFEDETTITQKPCMRRSMSFEGQQQKIEHNGSRNKFSAYVSMLWPDQKKLMYDFYDRMNSTNTIDYLENLRKYVVNSRWKRLILIWDHASFHVSKMMNDVSKCRRIG